MSRNERKVNNYQENIKEVLVNSNDKTKHIKLYKKERPISSLYSEIETDLARDNIETDLTSSDFQDL